VAPGGPPSTGFSEPMGSEAYSSPPSSAANQRAPSPVSTATRTTAVELKSGVQWVCHVSPLRLARPPSVEHQRVPSWLCIRVITAPSGRPSSWV